MWIRSPLEHKGIEETKGPRVCLYVVGVSQTSWSEAHPPDTPRASSHTIRLTSEVFGHQHTELGMEKASRHMHVIG